MKNKNRFISRGAMLGLVCSIWLTSQGLASGDQNALLMPLASQSLLLDIAPAGKRLVAVGERGHILLSDDSGESWTQATVPTRQMLTAVHFVDGQRGWAVGHDGLILASVDGGQNWVLQRDGLADQVAINQQLLETTRATIDDLEAELVRATDRELREFLQLELEELALDLEDAEYLLEEPLNAPPLLDVYFSDELNGVAVGAFNTLLRTSDGGINWTLQSSLLDNPDEFHLNGITGDAAGTLWIAGEGGVLFRSTDFGESWQSLASPYAGTWFGITARGSDTLLVFGLRGNAWRSGDGGDSWQRAQLPSERSLAGGVFVNDQYAVLVGSVGALWVSDDGGRSFSDHTLDNRLNLSAVSCVRDAAIAVGQGGAQKVDCFGEPHD